MELQMRLIIFSLLMVSSAAEEEENELNGVVGGSVTFPGPVVETGFFNLRGTTVASVTDRKVKIFREPYKDRLFWDNQTGLFTIRGLKKTDSGVYTVDSVEGTVFTRSYKLTVYEPVAAPVVKALIVSEDNCTFICSVEKTEETTLLWYKDGEILKQSSQALPLPLTVQDFSSAYSCVAANPAENKTLDVNATSACSSSKNEEPPSSQRRKDLIVVPVVLAVIVVLAMVIGCYFIKNKKNSGTQGPINRDSDVIYTDVQVTEDRRNQMRNTPDSSGLSDRSNLTTVYDKLQVHRISNAEADDHVYDQAFSFARA